MVFIEGLRGNVLFTGDFRLPLGCAARLMFFKENLSSHEMFLETSGSKKDEKDACQKNKNIKSLENLYIDMTFFKPEIR